MSVHLLLQRPADVRADGAREESGQKVDEPSHAAVGNGKPQPIQGNRPRGQHLRGFGKEKRQETRERYVMRESEAILCAYPTEGGRG